MSEPLDLDRMLAVARDAVAAADRLLAAAKASEVRGKSNPRDLVTEWDLRSEQVIRARLQAAAPDIAILGEEGGASGEPDDLRWLVDPIDGTVNFSHGLPIWGVSLALEERGQPVVGVVSAPALGWTFWGRQGGGAWGDFGHGSERLAVSSVGELERALLVTGFPYDRATSPNNNFKQWEHFQRRAGACRRLGAASLDLCFVARGWIDGYWERRLSPWDIAAGALIILEAGGRVTNTRGGAFDSSSGEAVASNGAIHEAMLRELAEADGKP